MDSKTKKASENTGRPAARTAGARARNSQDIHQQRLMRTILAANAIQRKIAVGAADSSLEKEADHVAQKVVNNQPVPAISSANSESGQRQNNEDEVKRQLQRAQQQQEQDETSQRQMASDEEETAQTKLLNRQASEDDDAIAQTLRRMAAESDEEQTAQAQQDDEMAAAKLMRQAADQAAEEETAQRLQRSEQEEENASAKLMRAVSQLLQAKGVPDLSEASEQKIQAMRGRGSELPEAVRQEMEQKIGADFSAVRVHFGSSADQLCQEINARAFTIGHDIFFASGEFKPETEKGKKLLAHELTHVVQQQGQTQRAMRSLDPNDAPSGNSQAQQHLTELSILKIPTTKQRHLPIYSSLSQRGLLKRIKSYYRPKSGPERPNQIRVWKNAVSANTTEALVTQKLSGNNSGDGQQQGSVISLPVDMNHPVNFQLADGSLHSPRKRDFLNDLVKIPTWNREGNSTRFQVDHIVELQVSGEEGLESSTGNRVENMELFDARSNTTSGREIMQRIRRDARAYYDSLTPSQRTAFTSYRTWLRNHDILFDGGVRTFAGRVPEGDSSWWTRSQIQELTHLDALRGIAPQPLEGSERRFVLASGPGGVEIDRFRRRANAMEFNPAASQRRSIAGMRIRSFHLNNESEVDNTNRPRTQIGTMQATWDMPESANNTWQPDEADVDLPIYGLGPHSGYVVVDNSLNVHFAHASPVTFNDVYIGANGVNASGNLTPSLSMLKNVDIAVQLVDGDILFRAEYRPDNLSLNMPGLTIDNGMIGLTYSGESGFGVDGSVDLAVNKVGDGTITAGFRQRDGFFAEGEFNFDSKLFDRATANLWYREGAFGGSGTLGIDSPDKVKGIRSAEINVGFSEEEFSAEGRVSLDIPGVEEAGLTIQHSEEEGLLIGGNLNLNSDTPGIRSGNVNVTLRKPENDWKVAATGTAVPDIPGIDSELSIDYNDGAITAEVQAEYRRGMLSGRVEAGVTNRSIDETTGELSDTAEPDNPLIVYGGGSLTLQLAPWLQGTAGVKFAPNGEMTVTGKIGLPDELEIFARRELNKSLLNIAVQAPIFPGIVAEIGGGLSAQAGIGPGVINELRLGVEYNPDREQDTRITGDASLSIPADAGLRLSVRAGIGLGITGASATGGLEIGGSLGVAGAAEASVHIEWTPSQGLDLEARVGVHAQPSFTFDISGYVSVRALGMSVYDNRWEFASYTFGSDYRFGISLPIHYQEGQPFDISLNDVEFEVPDINTNSLLRGLVSRIA